MSKKSLHTTNLMWGGRFSSQQDNFMEIINSSIDVDNRMAIQDIKGSIAHVKMLQYQKIIPSKICNNIIKGLKVIQDEVKKGNFVYDSKFEDIHMNIEKKLHDIIGDDAGYIHTARSRNDQVVTDFKMWVRDSIHELITKITKNMKTFLIIADDNFNTIMPGFTHLQTAQPVTFGHHMLAYVEMFGRDKERFHDAIKRLNKCPLGSAALAGTSYPIDRFLTSKNLGFDKPTSNSIDAVSDRDFALDFLSASAICATHLSRFAEELVIWASDGFAFIEISDSFSTGSSIMPQKRNPDAAELIRAKVANITGALFSLFTILKGLPLSYSKDLQEDKELVFRAYDNLSLMLDVMNSMMTEVIIKKETLEKAASSRFITSTDLADYLVTKYNYSFRKSHNIVGKLVLKAEKLGCDLKDLELSEYKKIDPNMDENVYKILSINNSVNIRTSYGGTAPSEVKKRIKEWKKKLK
ncbi:MAG: argininosuccinate lyase [Paracoccaceae bacterium]